MVDLRLTWLVSALVAIILGAICFLLAILERPYSNMPDVHKQRQTLACSALCLQATSCILESGYFYMRSLRNSTFDLEVTTGFIGRSAMCFTYASVLVVSWQWALLCGRIFGWKHKSRTGHALLFIFFIFVGFYMGTAYVSYSGKASLSFYNFINAFVSVFYILSAFCLLYYSRKICNTIEAWYSIGVSSSSNERPGGTAKSDVTKEGQVALGHSRRLYWAALVLWATCLLRAGCWSAQTFDEALYDDKASPWYYPLCFYQFPGLSITLTIMCLVGNADRRALAFGNWCYVEITLALSSQSSSPETRAAARASVVSPISNRFRLSIVHEDIEAESEDHMEHFTSEIDMADIYT